MRQAAKKRAVRIASITIAVLLVLGIVWSGVASFL